MPGEPEKRSVASGSDTRSGGADLHKSRPHLFHLTRAAAKTFEGGTIQQANEETFPIVSGQDASVVFTRLRPGGSGSRIGAPERVGVQLCRVRRRQWTVTEPGGYHESFEAAAGDLVFLPQGSSFHYFENAGTVEDLSALIGFNTSAPEDRDDIGVVASLNALSKDVLATVFGAPLPVFDALPSVVQPITIAHKQQLGDG